MNAVPFYIVAWMMKSAITRGQIRTVNVESALYIFSIKNRIIGAKVAAK